MHQKEFPCWQIDECKTIWIGELFSIINQVLKGVKDQAIPILFSRWQEYNFRTQLKNVRHINNEIGHTNFQAS